VVRCTAHKLLHRQLESSAQDGEGITFSPPNLECSLWHVDIFCHLLEELSGSQRFFPGEHRDSVANPHKARQELTLRVA
jgi:hypothetical protein